MQLASFMSELESSGLLKDEPASASTLDDPPADPQVQPADTTPLTPLPSTDPASLANPAAAIVSAVQGASDTPTDAAVADADSSDEALQSQPATDAQAAASQPATKAQADAGVSEEGQTGEGASAAAEQRVLGELQGAPHWHEVTLHPHVFVFCPAACWNDPMSLSLK